MQLIPNGITYRDIHQWLHHCWYMHEGNVYRFIEVRDTQLGSGGFPVDGHVPGHKARRVDSTAIHIHWPLCGSVNVDKMYAVHVVRLPARVYSRSYNAECVDVMFPRKWDILTNIKSPAMQTAVNNLNGDSHELVQALFNPEYPSVNDALADLERGARYSVAVSPNVILCNESDITNVFYRGKNVGDLTKDKQFINHDMAQPIEARIKKLLGAVN